MQFVNVIRHTNLLFENLSSYSFWQTTVFNIKTNERSNYFSYDYMYLLRKTLKRATTPVLRFGSIRFVNSAVRFVNSEVRFENSAVRFVNNTVCFLQGTQNSFTLCKRF